MTTANSIIVDAYREANIVPITGTPSAGETAEGLRRLNAIVLGCVGNAAGTELTEAFRSTETVEENTRLVLTLSSARTVKLDPYPYEGQRFAIADAGDNFATYNVTIDPNGRKIEGGSSLTLSENGVSRQWIYRADTADWAKVDTLLAGDEMPFPVEFDDYFITRLAIRLNPRNSTATAQETVEALAEAEQRLRARYRKRVRKNDNGALGLMGQQYGGDEAALYGRDQ